MRPCVRPVSLFFSTFQQETVLLEFLLPIGSDLVATKIDISMFYFFALRIVCISTSMSSKVISVPVAVSDMSFILRYVAYALRMFC